MESSTKNVPSVETPSADTLFEGQTWGWDGIDRRAVVAQNQNELDTLKPFLHRHIPTISTSQMFDNSSSTINVQGYEEGRYCSIGTWGSTTLFRSMAFNAHLLWMEKGRFLECHLL